MPAEPTTWHARYRAEFPGCVRRFRDPHQVRADLLVVTGDAAVQPAVFDLAWRLDHDHRRGNDVWVVGSCR